MHLPLKNSKHLLLLLADNHIHGLGTFICAVSGTPTYR
jgi:hypothetical protein